MSEKLIFVLGIVSMGILKNENFIDCCEVKQKQQYFPCSTNKNACNVLINLNSACIRCETCLLIANQIAQTLSIVQKQTYPKNNLNETQMKSTLTFVCDYSFENYGLKEINRKRVIIDYLPNAKPISTNVDGQWATHLKQRCRELTEVAGTTKLYETWQLSRRDDAIQSSSAGDSVKLETDLCQQKNAFLRDCRGIPMAERHNFLSHENERLRRQIINWIQREKMFS